MPLSVNHFKSDNIYLSETQAYMDFLGLRSLPMPCFLQSPIVNRSFVVFLQSAAGREREREREQTGDKSAHKMDRRSMGRPEE